MDEKLMERRSEIKRKLLHLEWDKTHSQINYAREMELTAYKKELETIEKEMTGAQNA